MEEIKLCYTTEEFIYPEEQANLYKEYLEDCEDCGAEPCSLDKWLENELSEYFRFDLYNSKITNLEEITKEVEKYLKNA